MRESVGISVATQPRELRDGRRGLAGEDGKVALSGNVHSWFERAEARQAAWAAPGVKEVDDRMAVIP